MKLIDCYNVTGAHRPHAPFSYKLKKIKQFGYIVKTHSNRSQTTQSNNLHK